MKMDQVDSRQASRISEARRSKDSGWLAGMTRFKYVYSCSCVKLDSSYCFNSACTLNFTLLLIVSFFAGTGGESSTEVLNALRLESLGTKGPRDTGTLSC